MLLFTISGLGVVTDFCSSRLESISHIRDFDLPPNSRLLAVLPVADGIEPEFSDTFSRKDVHQRICAEGADSVFPCAA